jgi:hypothetical protein
MTWSKEMLAALEADGEKLRQLTGEDHGPFAFVYIGVRKSDGSIRATCCDDPGEEEDTASKIADWIKRGLAVERLTEADYKARLKL